MMINAKVADVLRNPDALATALLVVLMDEFGTECLSWEPETLHAEIVSVFNVQISQANFDKVQAMITVLTTNQFWNSLEAWMHITNALNGSQVDFTNYDPPTVQEVAWALAEVTLVDPPDEKEKPNGEILFYMESILKEEGFTKVPKLFRPFINSLADDSAVEEVLTADEVDSKAYFEDQSRRLAQLDVYVLQRLVALLHEVAGLPLQSADQKGLAELKKRADKLLAGQSKELQQVQESAPQAPFQ